MIFLLDDIFHEIGTVVPWLFFWFMVSAFVGYVLRGSISYLVFRWLTLSLGFALSFLAFFFFMPHLELEIVLQIFLFFFVWGMIIGFEHRFVRVKDLFVLGFWFPEKHIVHKTVTRFFTERKKTS